MSEVVVRSVKFKYNPTPEVQKLLDDFREMVNFCIDRALELKRTSLNAIHHAVYKELTSMYEYNTQYVISAIRVAFSVIKSAKRKGVEPKIKRRFIRFSPLLTKFDGSSVRISVKPREFVTIPLEVKDYHKRFIEAWKRGELKIGEIILNDYIIIPFKKEIDLTESGNVIAFDVNERSLEGLTNDGIRIQADISEVKRLRDTYFKKRRGIQTKLSKKPTLMKKVLVKYRSREKNKVRDFLHKVSKAISNLTVGYTIIMENLSGIRGKIRYGKVMNRRLHSWNFHKIQSFIKYKAKLNGSKVVYIDPKNTSRACSICGGIIRGSERACSFCGIDRHINACINLLKKTQNVARQGSAESPLMKLLKSGTGEARIGSFIKLSIFRASLNYSKRSAKTPSNSSFPFTFLKTALPVP